MVETLPLERSSDAYDRAVRDEAVIGRLLLSSWKGPL
jgi:hypothetical protein